MILGEVIFPLQMTFKLDMRNAFNECDRSVFLEKVKACLFGWAQWCYTFPAELRVGT